MEPLKQFKSEKTSVKKNLAGQRSVLFYQETCVPNYKAVFSNGVFSAFLYAYKNHGIVKFTPDDIWLTIINFVSKMINLYPQELRDRFVFHKGKMNIQVITERQEREDQWDQFFEKIGPQIKKNTKEGIYDDFASCFSTTNRITSILSTATIMNGFKKYFNYGRMILGCGITAVLMGGKLQDWLKLKEKLLSLKKLKWQHFDTYVDKNVLIIDQFINTYQQKVDVNFWNKICNEKEMNVGSGQQKQTYFSGWLNHLFGYYQKAQQIEMERLEVDINLTNQKTGKTKKLQLLGGSLAVNVEENIYSPHFSVCIVEKGKQKEKEIEEKEDKVKGKKLKK